MSTRHTQNDTAYWVYNDDPKLPVMIMIHGLRGTHHGLDLIAKQLNGYRIIVPDLPGFFESKPLEVEHSINNYVKWLNEFIKGLNLSKPPVLFGHSFGSIIASYYIKKYPNSVTKLILVNPIGSSVIDTNKSFTSKLAIGYYWLSGVLPESLGTRLLSSKSIVIITSLALTKTKDKQLREWIHNQHLQYFSTFANRQVVNEAFKASINNSVRDVASDITVSTLIIAGELDNITPLDKQKELFKLFPHAKLVIIKGVGHITQYETPDEIVSAVNEFMSER